MEIKKNWKINDTVMPSDLNRIEGNIEEAVSTADNGKEAVETLKNEVNQNLETTKTELKQNLETAKSELSSQIQELGNTHVSKIDFEAKAKELVKKIDSLDEEYVLKCYDTSGEITLPSDAVHKEVDVVCVAGGGGGFRIHLNNQYKSDGSGYGGARGGYVHHKITVGAKKKAKIFIGAGGKGDVNGNWYSTKGGATVFQCTEAVMAICGYNKNYPGLAGLISKPNNSWSQGYEDHNIRGLVLAGGEAIYMSMYDTDGVYNISKTSSIKPMPIILPTKEITTYSGEANGDGNNATEYGCGGNGGKNSISGGDGKQGCVYIGYWRKKK